MEIGDIICLVDWNAILRDENSSTVKILFSMMALSVTVGVTTGKHHQCIFRDEKGLYMTQVNRRKIEQIL